MGQRKTDQCGKLLENNIRGLLGVTIHNVRRIPEELGQQDVVLASVSRLLGWCDIGRGGWLITTWYELMAMSSPVLRESMSL
jgi:hypothetical protein